MMLDGKIKPTPAEESLDYRIVIPSRGRTGNMPYITRMYPTALIYVDEVEYDDYAKYVDEERLITHPSSDKMSVILNYLVRNIPSKSIAIVDDDMKYPISLVGRRTRKIDDPDSIIRIIENGVVMLNDADLGMFMWTAQASPMHFKAGEPLKFISLPSGAFILRGKRILFDEELYVRLDLDMLMKQLLENRIILADTRFYWQDMIGYQKGSGGLQAVRTREIEEFEREYLYKKWGRYINLEKVKANGTTGVHIALKRKL